MHNLKLLLLIKRAITIHGIMEMGKYLMHLKLEGGPSNNGFMKCVAHVQFVIKSPWDFGGGCQRM